VVADDGAPVRRWSLLLLCAVAVGAGPALADEVEVELVGFLAGLPEPGLRLPLETVVAAELEVPDEQGGRRLRFKVELTPRTEVRLRGARARNDQLVQLEGFLRQASLLVRTLGDVQLSEFTGRVSLPDRILALPVATDRMLTVFLDGSPNLPVPFVVTPRTEADLPNLHDGERVKLAVVRARRIAVGIEAAVGASAPRR